MIEKEIIFINAEEGINKNTKEKWYRVNYLKEDRLKTDYISVIEYNNINKKAKRFVPQTGFFSIDKYDKLYLSDIK